MPSVPLLDQMNKICETQLYLFPIIRDMVRVRIERDIRGTENFGNLNEQNFTTLARIKFRSLSSFE